jgi:transcriptional regulator with XRE-family HTH domain
MTQTMATTESDALDAFRKNVQIRIDEGHITVAELARKSNLSRPVLSDILHGHAGINLTNADKVAQALGLTLSELLDGKKV